MLRRPASRGGLIALSAAVLFGIGTPLVERFGQGIGSFSAAARLYTGVALAGALLRRPLEQEARVQRVDAKRLALMALFGAVIGAVALAWGAAAHERCRRIADADARGRFYRRAGAALYSLAVIHPHVWAKSAIASPASGAYR